MYYGGDYNPEQWPEDVWLDDVELMREAKVNFVNLGIFSWGRIQPAEGEFDFGWLDRALDLLHENGVAVDLATATATPPPWAGVKYPGILAAGHEGQTMWHGSRQHASITSPDYVRLSTELVKAIVARYGQHPGVVMWHVNNELGCHLPYDYSDNASVAFRDWLRTFYAGDIDALNAAWNTAFWSQHYTDFDQIVPPRSMPYTPNPSGLLDWRRFGSDAMLNLVRREKQLIRDGGATQPVTTNMINAWPSTDIWQWSQVLDVMADDSYPDPRDPDAFRFGAFARDVMRSAKPGVPWILMEQSPNAVSWMPNGARKKPGELAAMSMQGVARGADGVGFFQWRQAAAGAEKYHAGMVPPAGRDTRTFREVVGLGEDLAALPPLPLPGGEARVAIVLDWDSWWVIDQKDVPAHFAYDGLLRDWHATFHAMNVQVDFVRSSGPFDGYSLVVAPSLTLLRAADAAGLIAYVEGGGRLLVTAFSDIVDEHDRFRAGGFTTQLGDLLGLRMTDLDAVELGVDSPDVVWGDLRFAGESFAELVKVEGADVLGVFAGGPNDGEAALTRHASGSGEAYYVATFPDADGRAAIATHLVEVAGIHPVVAGLPPRVEAAARGDVVTLLNFSGATVTIDTMPGETPFELASYEYRFFNLPRATAS
jgi:beta-galactosidase